MNVRLLLIGTDLNAYYMARCYYEKYGISVDLIGTEPMRFTKFSSIVKLRYNKNLQQSEVFCEELLNYAEENKTATTLLVACHDIYVDLLVKNKELLKDRFLFNYVDYELLQTLLKKDVFYEKYSEILDIPTTYTVSLKNNDYSSIQNLDFSGKAYVIKPADTIEYSKHPFTTRAKVYKADSYDKIKNILESIRKSGYNGNVIVQDYIEGDDTYLFNADFYCSQENKVWYGTLAQVGLQECRPTAIGCCTVLINGYNQYEEGYDIVYKLKSFLENINYKGFAEFDIKYDIKEKKYKILEINPRQARSSYYLAAIGHNLIDTLIEDIIYNNEKNFELLNEKVLMSMVSRSIINKYIANNEYKKQVEQLIEEKKCIDPMDYKQDRSVKQRFYLILRKINYIRKYRKFKDCKF